MHSELIEITTGGSERVVDLTDRCSAFVSAVVSAVGAESTGSRTADRTVRDGLLHVFVPHATAGVAVIETGAGSDDDLLSILGEVLPREFPWRHRHGSPGHGRDHVLPAFVAPSMSLPVLDGAMALGTWQRVCLVDTNLDNTVRNVRLSFLPG